jgi:cystathionine beta-lyase/cystathionine gamma-synthase
MQQSIYQKATNAKQILWYLKNPTKTKDAEFIAMSLDDYGEPMRICKHILKVMGNYLKTVDTSDDVRNTLVPNPDNWIWKEPTVYQARKEVWGY